MIFGKMMASAVNTAEQVTDEVTNQVSFIENIVNEIHKNLLGFTMKVIFAAIFFAIGTIIIHFVRKAIHKAMLVAEDKNGFQNGYFFEQVIKFVLYSILIVLVAQYFGVSATGLVAVLGSAGLTLGLGFQGALSNFAGGVLLLLHKPFTIGDYLVLDDKGCEGKVIRIGMMYTVLAYQDLKTVIVPNGEMANTKITNLSHGDRMVLQLIVSISYSSDILKAKNILKELAESDPGILKDREITVFVNELAGSSVDLGLRVWVMGSSYSTVKWRLLENIKDTFDKNNIVIPFNQLDVHVDSGTLSQN